MYVCELGPGMVSPLGVPCPSRGQVGTYAYVHAHAYAHVPCPSRGQVLSRTATSAQRHTRRTCTSQISPRRAVSVPSHLSTHALSRTSVHAYVCARQRACVHVPAVCACSMCLQHVHAAWRSRVVARLTRRREEYAARWSVGEGPPATSFAREPIRAIGSRPKVDQPQLLRRCVDQEVGRFEIAMGNPAGVHVRKALQHVMQNCQAAKYRAAGKVRNRAGEGGVGS